MRARVDLPDPQFADDAERPSRDDREADADQRGAHEMRREGTRPVQPVRLVEVDDLEERRRAHARGPSSAARQQREAWRSPNSTFGGRVVRQTSIVISQRPANGQPAPTSRWCGGEPGMVLSRDSARRAGLGARLEQRPRVRVPRVAQHHLDRPALHDQPAVHDQHPAAVAGDHREVVADEDQRHPRFGPEAVEQRQDPRLDGDVERRRRLVGDDEARAAADRHGDHRPLPFAAGKPEGIRMRRPLRVGEADVLQQADRLGRRRLAAQGPMQDERLGDLRPDPMQRVQGGHRLLEDHRDPVAAERPHRLLAEAHELAALEADRAADARALRGEPHQRERGHRLAGAQFADDAEALALVEAEGRAVDDADGAARARQVDDEVLHLEQHVRTAP